MFAGRFPFKWKGKHIHWCLHTDTPAAEEEDEEDESGEEQKNRKDF